MILTGIIIQQMLRGLNRSSYSQEQDSNLQPPAYETGELPLLLPCNDSRLRQRTGYSYGFYDTLMIGPHSRSGLWLEHIGKRRAYGYDSAYVGDFWWKDGIGTHIIQIHNLVSCRWTTFHMVLRRRIRISDILLPRQAGCRYRIRRCTESAGFEPAVDFSTTG